eukprot:5703444-Amphidinium_carterae.1
MLFSSTEEMTRLPRTTLGLYVSVTEPEVNGQLHLSVQHARESNLAINPNVINKANSSIKRTNQTSTTIIHPSQPQVCSPQGGDAGDRDEFKNWASEFIVLVSTE